MGSPMSFVDYFNYKINFVKRVTFNEHTGRTSGEGAYLFADDLGVGMATPADCEGVKMEFKYGVAPSSVAGNGKMVHGLDIKMIMDQDWDFTLKPYNATVRGARIQAYSQADISGRLMGAYINAQAQGTYEIEGFISGETGPGMIGIEARTELATSAQITTPNAVGVLIFHRNKQDADIITGGYRGLQVEVPLMGTGASIEGTTYGIYVGNDWGGTDYFDCGLYIKDSMATTGIQIGDCTTGITLDGTMTTGLNIATGCTTGISVIATTGILVGSGTTTGISIDADDCPIVLGDGQDASISWDTTHTQDVLAIGVGASRALVLMDKADVGSGGTTDVLDFTTLSNPGILFMTATPVASTYAFIRTYNIGADMHFVMKGSGDYTALILQPEDDSNNDTFFQWRCHEGAYPYLWENFTRGVVRSYNASPYTVLAMKDYETTLAVVKTGTGEDPVVTPCLILGDNNSNSHCIGIQFNDDGSGQRRLKIFDEAGNNVYIDPTSTTIEAS